MNPRIFLSPPHMSGDELRMIEEAFDSNYIAPLGPMVDEFEKEFAEKVGIPHAVALASGTAAMHLALDLLDVNPHRAKGIAHGERTQRTEDRGQRSEVIGQSELRQKEARVEVIASTLTFIGSVTPVTFLGATPVFIDADRTTWNMDPVLLEEELDACYRWGRMPKAVIPTDLYGQCVDYGRILPICEKYGVPVVADAAEALGAMYCSKQRAASSKQQDKAIQDAGCREQEKESHAKAHKEIQDTRCKMQESASVLRPLTSDLWFHAGYGAKAAIFSFNGNKIITTSGGGMLVSEDREFIEKARNLSQQARDPAPHYEHTRIGYNYRMSNVLAAIGRGQLRVLDDRVDKKRSIFDYYKQALGDLPGIEFMPEPSYARSTRWLTVVLITPEEAGTDREQVRLALEEENIEARPVWKPMHMQPVFDVGEHSAKGIAHSAENRTQNAKRVDYSGNTTRIKARVRGGEVAEDLFRRGLCLPSGTAMTEEDLERVVKAMKKCWKTAKRIAHSARSIAMPPRRE